MNLTTEGRPDGPPTVEVAIDDHESPLVTVTRAVAAIEGVPPVGLPPIRDAVDPDALNGIVRSLRTGGFLAFEYAGYAVAVRTDGEVEVYDEGECGRESSR